MKRCPITYENIPATQHYSKRGLHSLSPKLNSLKPLELSAKEQREESIIRAGKMSLQGVQPKLSAQLSVKKQCFDIVDQGGHYILKPQSDYYPELPENEAVTMSLAERIGLDVPVHGLIAAKDNSMTYFIKRFDRMGRNKKLQLEDFSQLSGADRDTKYNSSMEKISKIISTYCTFPTIEFLKLFKLTLFNFLVGNEDMHLKNFSLIVRDNVILLSPAYDLLNSTIAQKNSKEEIALPLNGKKNNLNRKDFVNYFGMDQLGLNEKIITEVLAEIQQAIPHWRALLEISFLSTPMREKYLDLLNKRCKQLEL